MGDPYNKSTNKKVGTIAIFIMAIPLFAVSFYIQNLNKGKIVNLRSKYSIVNIERNCRWSTESNYISCFKKDFLPFTRKQTHYEGILAFDLFIKIKNHDLLKHTTARGKLLSQLDSIESIISFFEINKSKEINRDRPDFIGLVLAKLYRSTPIKEFQVVEKALIFIESEHVNILELNLVLKNRIEILKKRYRRIQLSLDI